MFDDDDDDDDGGGGGGGGSDDIVEVPGFVHNYQREKIELTSKLETNFVNLIWTEKRNVNSEKLHLNNSNSSRFAYFVVTALFLFIISMCLDLKNKFVYLCRRTIEATRSGAQYRWSLMLDVKDQRLFWER